MSLRLVEGDFPSFFDVPFRVYPESSLYVSPFKPDLRATLDPARNPFFQDGRGAGTFFTAVRGREPVGRIVAHVHHASNARWRERAAFFGFFDCADDLEAARALTDAAAAFGRAHQCTTLRGNMNLTAMQECGVVVDGFDNAPYVGQVFNPPHIPRLLQSCGFRGVYPMSTFVFDHVQDVDPAILLGDKQRALRADPRWRFRPLDAVRFDSEMEALRVVLNRAMHHNPHFVEISPREMAFQVEPFRQVLEPDLVWIAERDGEVVAATMCAPNVLPLLKRMRSRMSLSGLWSFLRGRRALDSASTILITVDPRFQAQGVIGALHYELGRALQRRGYRALSGTWIANANRASLRQAEMSGMRVAHRCDLFERAIADGGAA